MNKTITIAIAKGRILDKIQPSLATIGLDFPDLASSSRRLVYTSTCGRARLIIVRGSDVITYCNYGAAGLGIVGKDKLMEYDSPNVYEILDLGLARCRLVVAKPQLDQPATPKQTDTAFNHYSHGRQRIATKYTNIARQYFTNKGGAD